jgi:hypothetical protein
MTPGILIGLCDEGQAIYTDAKLSLEEQREQALKWVMETDTPLRRVLFVLGNACEDLSPAIARTWVKRDDTGFDWTGTYAAEEHLPKFIKDHALDEARAILAEIDASTLAEINHRRSYAAGYR